jgi:hypothetical protein
MWDLVSSEAVQTSLERLQGSGHMWKYLVLNKPPSESERDANIERKFAYFLNIAEISSVVGLGLGLLVAARRGKLRPVFNSWGLVFGTGFVFPTAVFLEERFPVPTADLVADKKRTARHRRALGAGAVMGAVFPLVGGGLLSGAQLGLAGSRIWEELGFLGNFK